MFLNDKDEIKKWLMKSLDLDSNEGLETIDKIVYFTIENEQLIINCNKSIYLSLAFQKEKELPVQFGIIDGDFYIPNNNLESFKGFPIIINGDLNANGNSFKSTKDWNIKEVNGDINLCSENCELDNLFFLENTKFQFFILKLANTPFIDNQIIHEDLFLDIINNYSFKNNKRLKYNDYLNILKELTILNTEIDDYLNNYDNILNNNINN